MSAIMRFLDPRDLSPDIKKGVLSRAVTSGEKKRPMGKSIVGSVVRYVKKLVLLLEGGQAGKSWVLPGSLLSLHWLFSHEFEEDGQGLFLHWSLYKTAVYLDSRLGSLKYHPHPNHLLHLYLLTFSVAVFLFSRDVSHFFFPGLLTWVSSNAIMSSLRLFILSQIVFWTLNV